MSSAEIADFSASHYEDSGHELRDSSTSTLCSPQVWREVKCLARYSKSGFVGATLLAETSVKSGELPAKVYPVLLFATVDARRLYLQIVFLGWQMLRDARLTVFN